MHSDDPVHAEHLHGLSEVTLPEMPGRFQVETSQSLRVAR